MKRIVGLFIMLCTCLPAFCIFGGSKTLKIAATPDDAKIHVDGSYLGDGIVTVKKPKKDDFIVLKIEKEGYIPVETKIYGNDDRKAISYTLREDPLEKLTIPSDLVNKYFTLAISKNLYTYDESSQTINAQRAWKMLHQILLNYFDEIQTSDMSSGFIQTPWNYSKMIEAEKVIRSRVSVREISSEKDLIFQVKIDTEISSLRGYKNSDNYREIDRIPKDLEPLISELQSRLTGKY